MNSAEFSLSMCRICLQDGATHPIFDESTTEASILSQLNKCFMEKIEDLEGYPRYVCYSCKITSDMLCEFIDKYRKSCELLRETLVKVKTEVDDSFIENYNDFIWDNEVYVIKVENDTEEDNVLSNPSEIIEKLKPLPGLKITKVDSEGLKRKESKTIIRKSINRKKVSSLIKSELECNGDRGITETIKLEKIPQKTETKPKLNLTKLFGIEKKMETKYSSVICDYCGAIFKQKYKLQNHIMNHHLNVHVTCKICSKTYLSKERFERHSKRSHVKKTFQCEQCFKMYTTRGTLNSHIRAVHNKHLFPRKRDYSCKFCDKTFKSTPGVEIHERSVHTGERPAVCDVCGKAFFHIIYLKEHMRIHTGELPFKCPFCDRGCTILGNIKSHLRTHKTSELNDTILSKMKPGYFKYLKKD